MLNNTGDIQAWYHGVRAIAARNCQVSQGNSINDLPENKQNLKMMSRRVKLSSGSVAD